MKLATADTVSNNATADSQDSASPVPTPYSAPAISRAATAASGEQLAPHVAQQRRGVAPRARDDGAVAVRPLRTRQMEKRRRRLADRVDFVIADDADDLKLGSVGDARSECLADGALPRPVPTCE